MTPPNAPSRSSPFQYAQYAQVFPLKPAPFCKLFAGLDSTNKPATSHLFSSSPTLALSSLPSFLLPQSLWQEPSSLSSCSIRLQWVHGHSFLPGNDVADELTRREALLVPSAIPCSLSPLNSRIHSSLFSDWRRTVSSKFFDTHVSSISTEELVLLRHVLSRLRCNGHSLYLSRIGRIENPSCSACGHSFQDTSHSALSTYKFFAPLALSLSTTSGPDPGELPGFWGSMVFRHAPIPRKGSGNNSRSGKLLKALHRTRMKPTFLQHRF